MSISDVKHSQIIGPFAAVLLILMPVTVSGSAKPAHVVCSSGAIVCTACPEATMAGVRIIEAGGNAVDAAVAVGFALAVAYPQAGNIGGGGFMLSIDAKGAETFVDFREKAPGAANSRMYLDDNGDVIDGASTLGAAASGVPGTVAGLYRAWELMGRIKWSDLLAPAIELARQGFPVDPGLSASLERLDDYSERFPALAKFRRQDGTHLAPGDTLRQPLLADCLEMIAQKGPDAFYRGVIARMIVSEMKKSGGLITAEDLGSYEAVMRKPVRGEYRGYTVVSAPPPSSGGIVLIEILNMLEGFTLDEGFMSASTVHIVAEAEMRAYRDRSVYLGDPDFVAIPSDRLLSKEYAKDLAAGIGDRATAASELPVAPAGRYESEQTTHYSIIGPDGDAVAVTTTLNSSYGSKVVVEGAGFLMNNEMDDFSVKPGAPNIYGLTGGKANAIAPGKRMLSSMSPTIVLDRGKVFMVVGTPGGSTIITTVAQIIMDLVDFNMKPGDAVAAPRFHDQWLPDVIYYEKGAFGDALRRRLEDKGYELRERGPIGDVQLITVYQNVRCGVSDPRGYGRPGAAVFPTDRPAKGEIR